MVFRRGNWQLIAQAGVPFRAKEQSFSGKQASNLLDDERDLASQFQKNVFFRNVIQNFKGNFNQLNSAVDVGVDILFGLVDKTLASEVGERIPTLTNFQFSSLKETILKISVRTVGVCI